MSARSPFQIVVGDLATPGSPPRDVVVEETVDWSLQLSQVSTDAPLRATLRLVPVSGGLVVQGSVTARVRHVCHRCLATWDDEPFEVSVAQLYARAGVDDADYELSGDVVDLEPMLRDEVLLAMPLLPTCPDGCELDVTPEPDEPASSPFAVLRELLPPDLAQ